MQLRVHNSLTGRKEDFEPIEAGKVGIYVCGLTVYDLTHMGHARMMVAFDMIVRYLRARGFQVTFVRNITDIDDKIIARAAESNESVDALVERMVVQMHEDLAALGVLLPDIEPRATENVDGIIAMIATLIDKGHAYAADNGDVYYRVASFDDYGKLSGKKIKDLRAGARVEVEKAKEDPVDFALWKAAKPGEPEWDSPWGKGRPGWHVECSVMSTASLGNHFDIHGGGIDLIFPHHENEIAQTEAATGERFANYWLHNGHLNVKGEKMSKSLGNFFVLKDVLENYRPEEVRYFLLSAQYRSPLNYTKEDLNNARAALCRLYTALRGHDFREWAMHDTEYSERFYAAMDDDFNTPEALAVLFDLVREVNRLKDSDPEQAMAHAAMLQRLGSILGFLEEEPETYLKSATSSAESISDAEVKALIAERAAAREAKDFARSDQIREELAAKGVMLEDGAGGTTWRRQ
ncbi:MAG: cysteine--tRNA ligase [Gammaproteobacteria bacterium]|nr:MAG: cysteine--tRNA ligase [Gammaproteobacteria bacterium]